MRILRLPLVLVLAFAVTVNAFAWVQFLAPVTSGVMWLGRLAASQTLNARIATEWSIAGHGALISYLWWSNQGQQQATTTPIQATIIVHPSDKTKRDNPDPKRFDDAAGSSRDVTPKATYAGAADQNYASAQNASTIAASQPAGASFSVAVNGQTVVTSYRSIAFETYSGTSDAQKCSSLSAATNPGSGWALTCPAGTSSDGKRVALWAMTAPKTCDAGYTVVSGNCSLTDTSQVMKPASKVPCEVLQNTDGTWSVDMKNPACVSLQNAIINNGKTLTYGKSDGTYDSVTTNADGSKTVNTGNRTIELGAPDSAGDSPIKGISDAGPGGSSGSGSGTGTGTGTGGTGGAAVCGGPGLPACDVKVDDSAFQSAAGQIDAKAAELDVPGKLSERQTAIESKATEGNTFGIDKDWIPNLLPGSPVQCANIPIDLSFSRGSLAGFSQHAELSICESVDIFRQYYAYLFGLITFFAIAMLFFGSNGNAQSGKAK